MIIWRVLVNIGTCAAALFGLVCMGIAAGSLLCQFAPTLPRGGTCSVEWSWPLLALVCIGSALLVWMIVAALNGIGSSLLDEGDR